MEDWELDLAAIERLEDLSKDHGKDGKIALELLKIIKKLLEI